MSTVPTPADADGAQPFSPTPRQFERHPDVFTPEEATVYLHLLSVETLRTPREKKVLLGNTDWRTVRTMRLWVCGAFACPFSED